MTAPAAPLATRMAEGGVLWLTLDRPRAANALDSAVHGALVAALRAAVGNEAVRAIVITGAGERVFSGGADLKEFAGLPRREAGARLRALLVETLLVLLDTPKPVLAAVQGKAVGGGCMLALAADEALLAEGAVLSMPEIALGMPSPIGAAIVAARGGLAAAQRLVQAGEAMAPAEAVAGGMARSVHPQAELATAAQARAEGLARLAGRAYAVNKAWMNGAMRAALLSATEAAEAAAAAVAPQPLAGQGDP